MEKKKGKKDMGDVTGKLFLVENNFNTTIWRSDWKQRIV